MPGQITRLTTTIRESWVTVKKANIKNMQETHSENCPNK
jgi:hypothetical protein